VLTIEAEPTVAPAPDLRRAETELQNAIELIRRGRRLQAKVLIFRALEVLS
jgi:hypothetical protein